MHEKLITVWRWLLPPREDLLIPWTATEILAVLFLSFILIPAAVSPILHQTHFLAWLYGWPRESLAALLVAGACDAGFPGSVPWGPLVLAGERGEIEKARYDLWMGAVINVLLVAAIPVLLRLTSGSPLSELGLSRRFLFRYLLAGLLAWVFITPFLYALQVLLEGVIHGPPEKHGLEQVALHHPLRIELFLIPFTAMVAAPLGEELLFRGVLQQWLARRSEGGFIAMAASLALALLHRWDRIATGWADERLAGALAAAAPVLFVLALVPGFLFIHLRWRSPAADAIFGCALFFAAGHSTWPHPIPLFVLGLALGYLMHRTQSLAAPVMLHMLFNGVACVQLLLVE